MCRWFSYIGEEPVLLSDILITPKHALTKQIDSHFLPQVHLEFKASDKGSPNPLSNLDGFGVSYYTDAASQFDITSSTTTSLPCTYHTIRPMLNDRNLLSLANNTSTKTCFAHIRAGTGLTPTVETNNHPFIFGRFSFMHNGVVGHHFEITVKLLGLLSSAARKEVKGTTDSEQVAGLFVTHLDPSGPWLREYKLEEMEEALRNTILDLQRLIDEVGGDGEGGYSALNFAVTDGTQMVTTRFSHPSTREAPSLYYSQVAGATLNRKFEDHPDGPQSRADEQREKNYKKLEEHGKHVIIASEPSTYKKEDWHLIDSGMMVSVTKNFELKFSKVDR